MDRKRKNTLFIGNGFSRVIFKDMPSWGKLFDKMESEIKNYTILYEMFRLDKPQKRSDESKVKTQLIEQIKTAFSVDKINKEICGLEEFGDYLRKNNVCDIITTNYDKGIEILLCDLCGYKQITEDGVSAEVVYSIRTHKVFISKDSKHRIRLWKIHGDLDRIKSVTLGFDQYCGALSKIESYIKGKYEYEVCNEKRKCKAPMIEKCRTGEFDDISWAELFFKSNVYIVGFGMDFSEIDIWWILNKRARFKAEGSQIKNSIIYLYDKKYKKDQNVLDALNAFDVECREICSGFEYVENIFEQIT